MPPDCRHPRDLAPHPAGQPRTGPRGCCRSTRRAARPTCRSSTSSRTSCARTASSPSSSPTRTGTKANLLATFPAADGTTTGGIVLSGHTDVVPVDGQDWSSEPFVPEIRDGRLYGRGTCDMKAFIGSVMTTVPRLSRTPLSEPVHLAFSYDEEVGCVGAVSLVDEIVERGLRPRACIVGEPTSMRVIRGHKSLTMIAGRLPRRRGPLLANPSRRQRDRVCRPARPLRPWRRRRVPHGRPVRRALRRALHDGHRQPDRGRDRRQHRSRPSARSPSSSARSGPSTSTPRSRRSAPRRAASRRPCGRRTPTPASRSPSARRRPGSTPPTTRTSSTS